MEVWDLVVSSDKIIVLTQVAHSMYSNNSSSVYTTYSDMLVTVYNKQLVKTANIIVHRNFGGYIRSGQNIWTNLKGNKLRLLFNRGRSDYGGVFAQINLDNNTIEKNEPISQGTQPNDAHLQPKGTLLFGNMAVVPYYIPRGLGTGRWVCQYKTIAIE